ncbi:hypothetical protein ACFODO_23720 [Acinetobacter sichuanensis]|uniref:YcxB family protein n=1 Tax=Acinetobacter sichuanensis TaxID=2136183 RepID=A0ABV7BNU0_9GAMM
MNICIGGCWDGKKLLNDQEKGHFCVKDKIMNKLVVYERFVVTFKGGLYIFWVSNDLEPLEAFSKVKSYFKELE